MPANHTFRLLMLSSLLVAVSFAAPALHAKTYTVLIKNQQGTQIFGAGEFEYDPNSPSTVSFDVIFDGSGAVYQFQNATVDSETDHADCEDPDAAPQNKICPSRVRGIDGTGSLANPESPVASGSLTLFDSGSRDDRLGNWTSSTELEDPPGGTIAGDGTTFILSSARDSTVPAPSAVLLLLAGLPALALVRRRLKRR